VNDTSVDLELNKGIDSNFFQELVCLDPAKKEMHSLGRVTQKLVATPDLEALFS